MYSESSTACISRLGFTRARYRQQANIKLSEINQTILVEKKRKQTADFDLSLVLIASITSRKRKDKKRYPLAFQLWFRQQLQFQLGRYSSDYSPCSRNFLKKKKKK